MPTVRIVDATAVDHALPPHRLNVMRLRYAFMAVTR